MLYEFKQTVFVYHCDLDEDQITFYDQFANQVFAYFFLATEYDWNDGKCDG